MNTNSKEASTTTTSTATTSQPVTAEEALSKATEEASNELEVITLPNKPVNTPEALTINMKAWNTLLSKADTAEFKVAGLIIEACKVYNISLREFARISEGLGLQHMKRTRVQEITSAYNKAKGKYEDFVALRNERKSSKDSSKTDEERLVALLKKMEVPADKVTAILALIKK